MRRYPLLVLALSIALLAACDEAGTTAAPDAMPPPDGGQAVRVAVPGGVEALSLTAVPAPEWNALFKRSSGWTGADGIFSIPLNGVDAVGAATSTTETLFLFSDTFIGEVRPDGSRVPGATLVNNTLAWLTGNQPDAARSQFYHETDAQNRPRAVFLPRVGNARTGDWYWHLDGLALGSQVYTFSNVMRRTDQGGIFAFQIVGTNLLSWPAAQRPLIRNEQQVATPFFVPATGKRGEIHFGIGVMANTAEVGAPNPDGYLYIYGIEATSRAKKLLVGRVLPSQFTTFSAWRFWNGKKWVAGASKARGMTSHISNELSVTPLADGTYLLVYQYDTLSQWVAVQVGTSPVGPWGPVQFVYAAPEDNLTPNAFVYNAKAHPHLSAPGELLISYNVNTGDFFGEAFRDESLYRPRFIRLQGLPQ